MSSCVQNCLILFVTFNKFLAKNNNFISQTQNEHMFLQRANEGKNDFWRYVITILIVIAGAALGGVPLLVVLMLNSDGTMSPTDLQEAMEAGDFSQFGISSNTFLVLMLLQFVIVFFLLWWMIVALHKKTLTGVMTARPKLDWRRIWLGFAVWGA